MFTTIEDVVGDVAVILKELEGERGPNIAELVIEGARFGITPPKKNFFLALDELASKAGEKHPDYKDRVRPLTLAETISARVHRYKGVIIRDIRFKKEQRLYPFSHNLQTTTAIAYKAGTTKAKVVPLCNNFFDIKLPFHDMAFPIPYEMSNGEEFDMAKYESGPDHPMWKLAVEDDALLNEYIKIVSNEMSRKIMNCTWPKQFYRDEIRPLCVGSLHGGSWLSGMTNMQRKTRFLYVKPEE